MQFVLFLGFCVFFGTILYLRYRLTSPRSSDFEAIDELMNARCLRLLTVTNENNYWRYWIRGRLLLSNCARIYVILAEDSTGKRREIHVAFDQWPPASGTLQVLLEREASE